MNTIDIIKEAYDVSKRISIRENKKGRNNNDLLVVNYTDDMVTFLKGNKTFELSLQDFIINVDYSDKFYRDMYCKEKVGMDFDKLQTYIENAQIRGEDCIVTQIGNKYSQSCAKRIQITVNGLDLVAAMTYRTVTGIRFPDNTIVRHSYSVTSSQWENQIL